VISGEVITGEGDSFKGIINSTAFVAPTVVGFHLVSEAVQPSQAQDIVSDVSSYVLLLLTILIL